MTTIRVTSQLVIELGREGTTSHRATSAGIFSTAVQESGKDGSDTVTVVTPRRLHVYHRPSKFPVAVQEVNANTSAELVC